MSVLRDGHGHARGCDEKQAAPGEAGRAEGTSGDDEGGDRGVAGGGDA